MMSDENLRVDATMLHAGGAKISSGAIEADDAFAKHHNEIEDCLNGWASQSGAAMQEVVSRWRSETQKITDGVDEHGGHFHRAGYAYSERDGGTATELAHVAAAISHVKINL